MPPSAQLLAQFPYLSHVTYGGNDYIGIIQNYDNTITTMYDFGLLKDEDLKELFLELGEVYWWTSNRKIPINLFLKHEWVQFRPYLRTMNSKEAAIISGPYVSLQEMAATKSKRKSITLVRR